MNSGRGERARGARRRLGLCGLALLLAVAAGRGAAAAEPERAPGGEEPAAGGVDPGPRAMERGVRFARAGGWSKALMWFERALPTMGDRSDVFYNLTTASEALGDWRRVFLYGRGFLVREPKGPESEAFAKKVDVARRKLVAAGLAPVPVRFAVEPAGVELRVDHTPLGLTGGEPVSLVPGKYTVEASAEGYEPWRSAVEVGKEARTVSATMVRRRTWGALVVRTTPPDGVAVYVDDRPAGRTPLTAPLALETGRVLVRFEKPGYDDWSRYVVIRDGQTETLEPVLEKARTR
ncbi:MAG: PEGA domain-containing protein [Deltaproteobacteria bacterium]|nr:PEGA domain-containing protein [Deltaproteobacteria bacterium]MCB9785586.1 PEGA domain-containing protein [Deltaproteobacteria bacterium]